jgi:hypothetical protein
MSVTKADLDRAAQAVAAGHYGVELTPTRNEVTKGASAFMRLGEAANQSNPAEAVDPQLIIPVPSWSPIDLVNLFSGSTLVHSNQWNVYLGCPMGDETCWGDPERFLTDLNGSKFLHVVDQYVGSTGLKRYPLVGTIVDVSPVVGPVNLTGTLSLLLAAVNAAAGLPGESIASVTGPGNIYHLFFNQGIDVCMDNGDTICYSPDNLSTFAFCGYHSYTDFGGSYGRVYFTVEPFQAVNGCFGATGDLTSATANVLSHELFEAITDPNLDAWQGGGYPLDNLGEEIGDQCVWVHLYPQKLNLLHAPYTTQNEYSNKYHMCVNKP